MPCRIAAWVASQEVRAWCAVPGTGDSDIEYEGLDLGSGLGTVMLMMCWGFAKAKYVSFEAQQKSVDRWVCLL